MINKINFLLIINVTFYIIFRNLKQILIMLISKILQIQIEFLIISKVINIFYNFNTLYKIDYYILKTFDLYNSSNIIC